MRPLIVSPRGHGYRPKTVTELLINLVEKRRRLDLETGCWIDTGTQLSRKGYTKIYYSRGWIPTTRFIWELTHAVPVPPGMLVCHRCDNPPCFNPEHLFLGTNKDNMHDMISKGRSRHPKGEETNNRKLNNSQVLEIRQEYASGGFSMRRIAQRYGISKTHVRQIVRKIKWKHL